MLLAPQRCSQEISPAGGGGGGEGGLNKCDPANNFFVFFLIAKIKYNTVKLLGNIKNCYKK